MERTIIFFMAYSRHLSRTRGRTKGAKENTTLACFCHQVQIHYFKEIQRPSQGHIFYDKWDFCPRHILEQSPSNSLSALCTGYTAYRIPKKGTKLCSDLQYNQVSKSALYMPSTNLHWTSSYVLWHFDSRRCNSSFSTYFTVAIPCGLHIKKLLLFS